MDNIVVMGMRGDGTTNSHANDFITTEGTCDVRMEVVNSNVTGQGSYGLGHRT
jgi:hypothetical protein